jgi:hypothetical protein
VNEAELLSEPDSSSRRNDRFVTWTVLIVIGAGILAFAAGDQFFARSPHHDACRSSCVANLKAIDGAKATWGLENHKDTNCIPTDAELFGAANYIREKPECPGGGTYTIGVIAEKPTCSLTGHTI